MHKNEESTQAAGAPVKRPVRPAAWMAHYRSRYDMPSVFVTTQHELAVENDAEGRPIPLYPQATIDAAVAAERERWEATVRRMHAADASYGCGFYNDDEWRAAYDELRAMCGPNS